MAYECWHHDESVVGSVAGGLGVLGASLWSGSMSFGAGAVDTAKDAFKSISLDDMTKAAAELKRREKEDDRKEAAEQAKFQADLAKLPESERGRAEAVHAFQHWFE